MFVIIPYRPAKLVKVFYFRYGIYPGAGPDVSYVEAAAFLMLAALAERRHDRGYEAQGGQRHEVGGIHICLDEVLQHFIIPVKDLEDPSLEHPALLCAFIEIPGPALVAAEFLVRTSVTYLIAAFQTDRNMSRLLYIHHCHILYHRQISAAGKYFQIPGIMFFRFLSEVFLFFIIGSR